MKRRVANRKKTELSDIIQHSTSKVLIPYIHITPCGVAREILESQKLAVSFCQFLKRDLLYFFAGRAAYRLENGTVKQKQISKFPFVFVILGEKLPPPFHVYPFDTGAALNKKYSDVGDPHVFFEDYELPASFASVSKMIDWAFGNFQDYMEARIKPNLEATVPTFDLTTRSYLDIANMSSNFINDRERIDDRGCSIEVAFDKSLNLKNVVDMVIIPDGFLEEKNGPKNTRLIEMLDDQEISWETFAWAPYDKPDSFKKEINNIILDRYA